MRRLSLKPRAFGVWLEQYIYGGRRLAALRHWPLTGFGICVIGFVATGAFLDHTNNKQARNGRLLRGPELISRSRFNWRARGDDLRLRLDNFRNPIGG